MWRRAFFLALCAFPLAAEASPKDELAKTQAALEASQKTKEQLAKQQQKIEQELTTLQEKLVSAAKALQKSDAMLDDAEKKLERLKQDVAQKEVDFAAKRQKLDGLLRIAIRLSRTPPQAMLLMPADGKNRIQAAHALALLASEMKHQAALLNEELETLQRLRATLEEDKLTAQDLRDANKNAKKTLEAALKSRKLLRDKLASSQTQEENKSAELAKKASSLQDFISALNREERKPKKSSDGKEVTSETGVRGHQGKMRDFKEAKGRIRIPVSGKMTVEYGDRDGGDSSKGIKILARSAAMVVAPFDAEVAYSGSFLNYGRLVILKHRGGKGDNYHTLLSGMSRIDVKTGDFLLEGEPIGAMDGKENSQLYVELRENNQPINPEQWMRGL